MTRTTKNGILVAAAVALGGGLSIKPWMLMRQEREEAQRLQAQAATDERQMMNDKAQEGRLGTELGKEVYLREHGYRKKNELPLNP